MDALDIPGNLVGPDGQVFFRRIELACPDSDQLILANGFATLLIDLRLAFGEPMIVGSCCRSHTYNARIGGHRRSMHVTDTPYHPIEGTAAIDILSRDLAYRWRLCLVALGQGWSVGVYSWGLHLDRRHLAGLTSGLFRGTS